MSVKSEIPVSKNYIFTVVWICSYSTHRNSEDLSSSTSFFASIAPVVCCVNNEAASLLWLYRTPEQSNRKRQDNDCFCVLPRFILSFFLSQRGCLANPAADRFHPAASSLTLLSCLSLDPPAHGSSRLLTCVETHQPPGSPSDISPSCHIHTIGD